MVNIFREGDVWVVVDLVVCVVDTVDVMVELEVVAVVVDGEAVEVDVVGGGLVVVGSHPRLSFIIANKRLKYIIFLIALEVN